MEGRGRVANKHIFMYDFLSAARSVSPGLINSRKSPFFSPSVFLPHTWSGKDFHIISGEIRKPLRHLTGIRHVLLLPSW